MATFEEVYGMTIEEHCEKLKAEGKWTECHEKGHDLKSVNNQVCLRCGADFNNVVDKLVGPKAAKERKLKAWMEE